MRALLLCVVFGLAACGNVSRPVTYTSVDDPIWQLTPDPVGGNEIARPPVAGNGRIKNGL